MPKCRKGKVIENKVGKYYKKAGYEVKLRKRTRVGEIDVYATRGREKIAIEVKHRNKKGVVSLKDVKKIAQKAKYLKAKPLLILSGNAKLPRKGLASARKVGVRVKRLKK